ncbi:hypothetical protein A3B39_01780 [Candidatus Daviesbacteria bacterium RIFCSPLOWO2_01_FULL_37_10]|nr:MAG: hypothetical protein A3B39_01780 [Candidatus Daviesbacteria bacterium RIFCSPLOWO2_01_FULL_37_10]
MQQISNQSAFSFMKTQPLIGIEIDENGQTKTYYFTDEKEADRALSKTRGDILSLAGVWSNLDWKEVVDSLDKIRHESHPSQAINL